MQGDVVDAERLRRRFERRWRARPQRHRTPGRLGEIKVVDEVAELARTFAHDGAWIGPAVGLRVEPRAAEEIILDELQVRIGGQPLVIYEAVLRVRADDQAGHPEAITLVIHVRR